MGREKEEFLMTKDEAIDRSFSLKSMFGGEWEVYANDQQKKYVIRQPPFGNTKSQGMSGEGWYKVYSTGEQHDD